MRRGGKGAPEGREAVEDTSEAAERGLSDGTRRKLKDMNDERCTSGKGYVGWLEVNTIFFP